MNSPMNLKAVMPVMTIEVNKEYYSFIPAEVRFNLVAADIVQQVKAEYWFKYCFAEYYIETPLNSSSY